MAERNVIQLHIIRGESRQCNAACSFLDHDFIESNAGCLLFKESLQANRTHGGVDSWRTCEACDLVYKNSVQDHE